MTALETYVDRSVALRNYQTEAVHRLAEWAESAQAASNVAAELVRTSFVPETFRGKPHEATAAILAGMECGLSPMAALRSFDIIQGQAAPRAITLRAIVQSFGHDMILEESTASRCKMRGRRNGAGEWQSVVWTIERARQLGLTNKNNWKSQPQAMLVARATSELARLVAADAILGIGYTVEEITDGTGAGIEFGIITDDSAPPNGNGEPAGSKRMSRRRPVEPTPEATPDPEPSTEDAVEGDVVADLITDAQMKKLHASFNDHGIDDRDVRLAYVADVLGHPVASSKDLTKAEASLVIDALSQPADELPLAP